MGLLSLVDAIRTPLVDELHTRGPRRAPATSCSTLVLVLCFALRVGYCGRKKVVDALLAAEGLVRLLCLQRSDRGGSLADTDEDKGGSPKTVLTVTWPLAIIIALARPPLSSLSSTAASTLPHPPPPHPFLMCKSRRTGSHSVTATSTTSSSMPRRRFRDCSGVRTSSPTSPRLDRMEMFGLLHLRLQPPRSRDHAGGPRPRVTSTSRSIAPVASSVLVATLAESVSGMPLSCSIG